MTSPLNIKHGRLHLQALLARAVLFLQIGISLLAFGGDGIFRALNMPPPAIYLQYRDKKTGVVLGAWIIGNMIQNALTQTGAFEVYSAGELVYHTESQISLPQCLLHQKFQGDHCWIALLLVLIESPVAP